MGKKMSINWILIVLFPSLMSPISLPFFAAQCLNFFICHSRFNFHPVSTEIGLAINSPIIFEVPFWREWRRQGGNYSVRTQSLRSAMDAKTSVCTCEYFCFCWFFVLFSLFARWWGSFQKEWLDTCMSIWIRTVLVFFFLNLLIELFFLGISTNFKCCATLFVVCLA